MEDCLINLNKCDDDDDDDEVCLEFWNMLKWNATVQRKLLKACWERTVRNDSISMKVQWPCKHIIHLDQRHLKIYGHRLHPAKAICKSGTVWDGRIRYKINRETKGEEKHTSTKYNDPWSHQRRDGNISAISKSLFKWVIDCCLTLSEQFISYIMARTN